MKKVNGGAGALICDGCRVMLVDGDRKLRGFATVPLPDGGEAHFCRQPCICKRAIAVREAIDAATVDDEHSGSELCALLLACERSRPCWYDENAPLSATHPGIALTPAMVEAMLSEPDLELAMGSTAADMVASGWVYQEAMVAIAAAFGERLRTERLKTKAFMRAAEEGRVVRAALEEYAMPEAFLR